jgi:hypothetical protein
MNESLLPLTILDFFAFSLMVEDVSPLEAKSHVGEVTKATGSAT